MSELDQRDEPSAQIADMPAELERGRECCGRRAWAEACRSLSLADQTGPLRGEDFELLALASYMTTRDDDYLRALERAHDAHLHTGARCAPSAARSGWVCIFSFEARRAGRPDGSRVRSGCSNARIAIARHQQGRIRIQQGQVEAGLALLDEAMVAVTAGELSPLVTGLIYCSVIEGCQQVYALSRACEWTTALAHWCDGQPEMVAFTGICRVHRSEIMQLHGAWGDAIEEARRACERWPQAANLQAAGLYQQAEVHRLRGEFAAAEQAYRSASQCSLEPQPGLALLWLAQQRTAPRPLRSGASWVRPRTRCTARGCCPPTSRSCSR